MLRQDNKLIDGWCKIGCPEAVTIMMDIIMTHHETKEKNIMDGHGHVWTADTDYINVHFPL